MTAYAYYNEHDPFAAAWLRELIRDNLIAPGEVDERSIEDVTPDELRPFRQCHFFAGIGVWSLAARLAGIPDDAPLWSGSCPCQPFSAAGKGGGFDDERHLWPAMFHLVEQRRPLVVVGEQVAGRDGDAWLDLVQSDVEATAYAFGAVETVACGFGAPHKRTRNYWMANRVGAGLEGFAGNGNDGHEPRWIDSLAAGSVAARGHAGDMADAYGGHANDGNEQRNDQHGLLSPDGCAFRGRNSGAQFGIARRLERPGPVNGFWRDADWLPCRDEKWRPVEPDTFPLADAGTFRNRVGLLRGAGNAVTIGQAKGFLDAVIASIGRWW